MPDHLGTSNEFKAKLDKCRYGEQILSCILYVGKYTSRIHTTYYKPLTSTQMIALYIPDNLLRWNFGSRGNPPDRCSNPQYMLHEGVFLPTSFPSARGLSPHVSGGPWNIQTILRSRLWRHYNRSIDTTFTIQKIIKLFNSIIRKYIIIFCGI